MKSAAKRSDDPSRKPSNFEDQQATCLIAALSPSSAMGTRVIGLDSLHRG